MCIIIFSPNGDIPKKNLSGSLDNNKDGWGIMWPENGKLQVLNGMGKGEFFRHWKWAGKIKSPKVFHARIGTSGNTDLDNCHPFFIPKHGQLAVAHNGIIHRQSAAGPLSDTRNFVNNVLAHLPDGFYKQEVYHELLGDYIGSGKLAFMDGEGKVYIVNEQAGYWFGGLWYSNCSYRYYKTSSIGFKGHQSASTAVEIIPKQPTTASTGLYDNQHSPPCQLPEYYKNIVIKPKEESNVNV